MWKRCPPGSRKGKPPSDHLCYNKDYPHEEIPRPYKQIKTRKVAPSKRCKKGTYKGVARRGQKPYACYHKDTNLEVTPVYKSQDYVLNRPDYNVFLDEPLYENPVSPIQNASPVSPHVSPVHNKVYETSIAVRQKRKKQIRDEMKRIEEEVLQTKNSFAKLREQLYHAIQSGNEDRIKELQSLIALHKQNLHQYNIRYKKLENKQGLHYNVGGVLSLKS
jgi:hypothetical protein